MNIELLYWIIVGISLLYLLQRYRHSGLFVLFILFFFEGFFTYWGQTVWNIFKIILPIFAILLIMQNQRYIRLYRADKSILWVFALFSIAFALSSFLNNDYLLLFLNQYSRFLLPVLILLLVKAHYQKFETYDGLKKLIWQLLNVQVGISVINFLLMGVHENIVGTMSSNGGSAATNLPVLGFMYLWLERKGIFSRKDWMYVFMLAFIGFVSGKRAIWLIMPVFIYLFTFYIPRRRLNPRYFLVFLLVPLFFYLGVRLNPTFNREQRIWGSFDYDYFYNYALGYTFGHEAMESEVKVGRGGSMLYALDHIFSLDQPKLILGNGLINMYAFNHDIQENPDSPIKISELNSITMATGVFQNYYTGGLVGVILFLWLLFSILRLVRHRRLRIVLILFFLWEYMFYANNLVRTPALFSLLVVIIVLSNQSTFIPQKAKIEPDAKN